MTAIKLDGKELSAISEDAIKNRVDDLVKKGVKPTLATILVGNDPASETYVKMKRNTCTSGVEPARVMYAPIPAIQTLLDRNELQVGDIDVYEHNEAFAAASCAVAKEIGIPENQFNLHGGAVSLGHPLGSSGTRCLMTMLDDDA